MVYETRNTTYRGHKLAVTVHEQRRGAWSWNYLIDGKYPGFSSTASTLPDAHTALRLGMLAARLRVEEME